MQYTIHNWTRAAQQVTDALEFLTLASTPCGEDCTQAGQDIAAQVIECNTYIRQLIRHYGPPPDDAKFFIIRNVHDFGEYHEAGIIYRPTAEDELQESPSYQYALSCEQGPEHWDDISLTELREQGHPKFQPAKIISIKKTA